MLNYEFPPLGGGAANATKYILEEFSKYDNLHIDLITSSIGSFRIENFSPNITIHYLDIGKNGEMHYQSNKDLLQYSWKCYWYCRKLLDSTSYDLAHAFFGIPCGFIAQQLKIPYIVSLRGSDVPFYNERFYWLDTLMFKRMSKRIWKNASFVVTNSQGLKELALSSSSNQEIKIIENGVDTSLFKPRSKKNSKLIVLGVGRLISRKGFEYLIKACEELDVEVRLVGDGPLKEELEDLAKRLSVRCKFYGNIEDKKELSEIYSSSDVFCLPSLNEGMSNTVLEAMASGLPLVVTNTGGSKELVRKNGFIVEMKNSQDIRDKLNKFSSDLIEEMGKQSRELAVKKNWGSVAQDYFDLYEEVE